MRNSLCATLGGLTFLVLALATAMAGCGSQTVGDQPGDQYNKALSQRQKSALEAHKNRDSDQ